LAVLSLAEAMGLMMFPPDPDLSHPQN
jgi:hypothetical protein